MRSLASVKDNEQKPIFNFAGIHYLEHPETKDNDLTILGYTSFEKDETTGLMLPKVTLDANQSKSFTSLKEAMNDIGNQSDGINVTSIDGNIVETFASYVSAPINEVITYDPIYSATYPPQLELDK